MREALGAFVLTSNERSQRVMDRLRFGRVALLPDHDQDEQGPSATSGSSG
jgi:RimJ/RimL family protein N-acetyltransferase